MKPLVIIAILAFAIACGKDNKSGSVPNIQSTNPIVTNEIAVKQDFVNRGRNVIRDFGADMNLYFQGNISSTMNARLQIENIYLTEAVIYSQKNRTPTSSDIQNYMATLYVGQQYPELNWYVYLTQNHPQMHRLIMHVLIELAGVQDLNYRHTDQILANRKR